MANSIVNKVMDVISIIIIGVVAILGIGVFIGFLNMFYQEIFHPKPPIPVTWIEHQVLSLRVDDDAEYHFTASDRNGHVISEEDVHKYSINIVYGRGNTPKIFLPYRCENGSCWPANSGNRYRVELPKDFKIETFDD